MLYLKLKVPKIIL